MSLQTRIAVGVDVSKAHLDVFHSSTHLHRQFVHSPSGIAELLAWIKEHGPVDVVVIEASGGYEMPLWHALCAADIPAARINPKRLRDFVRALGRLAKTDRIDARVLASFGATLPIEPDCPKEKRFQEMEAWLTRRQQLVEMRVAEKNRGNLAPQAVQKRIDLHLGQLQREIDRIDQDLAERIATHPACNPKLALLDGLKGVGANDLSNKGWRRLYSANHTSAQAANACSMANSRRAWCRSPVASHRPDKPAGPCACSVSAWWDWKSSSPSRPPP